MSTPKAPSRICNTVLDDELLEKLDAICEKLAKGGRPLSRSAALRALIRRFSLPGWTSKRSETTTKAAA